MVSTHESATLRRRCIADATVALVRFRARAQQGGIPLGLNQAAITSTGRMMWRNLDRPKCCIITMLRVRPSSCDPPDLFSTFGICGRASHMYPPSSRNTWKSSNGGATKQTSHLYEECRNAKDRETRQSKQCKTLRGPLSTTCYPPCIFILVASLSLGGGMCP